MLARSPLWNAFILLLALLLSACRPAPEEAPHQAAHPAPREAPEEADKAEEVSALNRYLGDDLRDRSTRLLGELRTDENTPGTLRPGEEHVLDLRLNEGDFFDLEVHQKSIDVRLFLETPEGDLQPPEKPVDIEKPYGAVEPFVWLAPTAGLHRLHILPAHGVEKEGEYEISFLTFERQADADTRLLARAQWLYLRALTISRQAVDRDDYGRAAAFYDDSEKLFRELDDPDYQPFLLSILNNTGFLYQLLEEYEKAQQRYDACVEVARAIDSGDNEASCLFNSASLEVIRGDNRAALELFEQALESYRLLYRLTGKKREKIGKTLDRIGSCHAVLGEPEKALSYFHQALELLAEINSPEQANTLLELTRIHLDRGHFREALETSRRALELSEKTRDTARTASAHAYRALVLSRLGETGEALQHYLKGQRLFRDLGDRRWDAGISTILGQHQLNAGRTAAAMHSFHQTLALYRQLGDRHLEAVSLERIAEVHEALGEYRESLDHLAMARELFEATGSVKRVAWNHDLTGRIYHQLGRLDEAESEFRRAIELATGIAHHHLSALSAYRLARTLRDQGRLGEALESVERALALNEDMRSRVVGDDLRSSFFAEYRNRPELHVDLLVRLHERDPEAGYDRRAFRASERARARTLNESLEASRLDEAAVHASWDASEQALLQRLAQLGGVLESNRADGLARTDGETGAAQRRAGKEERRRARPDGSEPATVEALDLDAVRALLPAEVALLEYVLGEDASYAFLVLDTELHLYRLPAVAELVPEVVAVIEDMRRPTRLLHGQQAQRSHRLLETLLPAPIRALADRAEHLLIVPDGALHYLNFEALRLGPALADPYLLERWRISYAPSATTLGQLRSRPGRPASLDLVAFGNPDYSGAAKQLDGAPLARAFIGPFTDPADILVPLPESQHEIERIAAHFDQKRTRVFSGREANERHARGDDPSRARYLHFATHSLLREDRPKFSSLVLTLDEQGSDPRDGEDGLLQVHEILDLELSADLVVLSACSTALGRELRGEGLVGLTQAFFNAGAPRLVASLWQVADASTAELMASFYTQLTASEAPAEALRRAKLELIRGGEYAQPYHWAPFVLIGQI